MKNLETQTPRVAKLPSASPAQEFLDARIQENGKYRKEAWLHALYKTFKDFSGMISPEEAHGYAALFRKYGWKDHAIKVSERANPLTEVNPIVDNLKRLPQLMPNQLPQIYEFGKLLADRLGGGGEVNPMGMSLVAELLLYDLRRGKDGFTGKPLQSSLVHNHEIVYAAISNCLHDIVASVAPVPFARAFNMARSKFTDTLQKNLGAAVDNYNTLCEAAYKK